MNQHTSEPWHPHQKADGFWVITDDYGYAICELLKRQEDEANSYRIVACVDGCKVLSTAALESGVVAELVAACRAINEIDWQIGYERLTENRLRVDHAVQLAQTALAKIPGAQP